MVVQQTPSLYDWATPFESYSNDAHDEAEEGWDQKSMGALDEESFSSTFSEEIIIFPPEKESEHPNSNSTNHSHWNGSSFQESFLVQLGATTERRRREDRNHAIAFKNQQGNCHGSEACQNGFEDLTFGMDSFVHATRINDWKNESNVMPTLDNTSLPRANQGTVSPRKQQNKGIPGSGIPTIASSPFIFATEPTVVERLEYGGQIGCTASMSATPGNLQRHSLLHRLQGVFFPSENGSGTAKRGFKPLLDGVCNRLRIIREKAVASTPVYTPAPNGYTLKYSRQILSEEDSDEDMTSNASESIVDLLSRDSEMFTPLEFRRVVEYEQQKVSMGSKGNQEIQFRRKTARLTSKQLLLPKTKRRNDNLLATKNVSRKNQSCHNAKGEEVPVCNVKQSAEGEKAEIFPRICGPPLSVNLADARDALPILRRSDHRSISGAHIENIRW